MARANRHHIPGPVCRMPNTAAAPTTCAVFPAALRANWRSIPRGAQCRDGGRIKPGRRGNGGVIEAGLANQIEGCFAPGSILSLFAPLAISDFTRVATS
jgi:hypothetical protein